MSPLISPEYQAQNRALYEAGVGYGRGGNRHALAVAAFAVILRAQSILDYGCGRGMLKKALKRYAWIEPAREYDPAIPAKSDPPAPADLVVCTDVLEHVEPTYLGDVLADLHRLGRKGAYLSIATRPSNKTLPDGRNAHLIVKPPVWWMRRIRKSGWSIFRSHRVRRKNAAPTDPERAVVLWLRT